MGNQNTRINEEVLDKITDTTNMDSGEVQKIYQTFVKRYPNGKLDFGQFVQIYIRFFPFHHSLAFIGYLFKVYDFGGKGYIDFEDYCLSYNVVNYGTAMERLRWVFRLYDYEKRKRITKENVFLVSKANCLLVGDFFDGEVSELDQSLLMKIDDLFKDFKGDSFSEEDFLKVAKTDHNLTKMLEFSVGAI